MSLYAPAFALAEDDAGRESLFATRTRILEGESLRGFRDRPLAVLSPHFDDACFSVGAFLAHLAGGHLVNVFTQGAPAAGLDQKDVHALRDREDVAFAARCRLTRHDLGCEQPMLRGRRPADLAGLADDLGQIGAPVLACLDKIARGFGPGQRGTLLAPLGLGPHVNHRALSALIAGALPGLKARYDVFFYEELPYASRPLQRRLALRRARKNLALQTRYAYPARWWSKRDLLQLYPSRFRGHPRPSAFHPASFFPAFPHEAFWSVT
jgi:hypothetical protein